MALILHKIRPGLSRRGHKGAFMSWSGNLISLWATYIDLLDAELISRTNKTLELTFFQIGGLEPDLQNLEVFTQKIDVARSLFSFFVQSVDVHSLKQFLNPSLSFSFRFNCSVSLHSGLIRRVKWPSLCNFCYSWHQESISLKYISLNIFFKN